MSEVSSTPYAIRVDCGAGPEAPLEAACGGVPSFGGVPVFPFWVALRSAFLMTLPEFFELRPDAADLERDLPCRAVVPVLEVSRLRCVAISRARVGGMMLGPP